MQGKNIDMKGNPCNVKYNVVGAFSSQSTLSTAIPSAGEMPQGVKKGVHQRLGTRNGDRTAA
jgi:hypothetical protein